MRGVAALSVVGAHILINRPDMGIDHAIAANGSLILQSGVDVFFVISGFIIATAAAEVGLAQGRTGALDFSIRRFARIYPLYWIVLIAAVITSYWLTTGPPAFPMHFSLDHVLLNTVTNYFVPVAWTLCFEVYFYAAIAMTIFLAQGM
jgi:exopolysaccharide production protein ExoZ